jgi:rod shape-determining protein MreD
VKTGWFVGLAVAAVVLDSAVAPEIEFLGARPDFLVLVVAYAGLVLGARPATIVGFILGLVVDAEQPEYLGLHALALSVIGYASAAAWEHLVRGSLIVQISVLFCAALAHDVMYYVIYFRNHLDMFARFFVRFGLTGAAYTAAFAVLIYALALVRSWRPITGGTRI